MNENIQIPILNVYYMICYAWNVLPELDEIGRGEERFEDIYKLLSNILLKKVRLLIKKGFYKEYTSEEDSLSTVIGKINIHNSINRNSLALKKIYCDYDELSENILFNQIIKYTILKLMECPFIDKEIKIQLKKLLLYFNNIKEVPPTKYNLSRLNYDISNKHYCIIINICQLIYNGLIVTESNGEIRFLNYLTENGMAKLFENFVLNFYKEKLDNEKFKKARSSKIKWNITGDSSDLKYLPNMITDIVLEKKDGSKKLIIDTKFYKETLKVQNRFSMSNSIGKINSNNMYQINTYINQDKFDGEICGMLLYPTVGQNLDLSYQISDKKIMIKTIDLNTEWYNIENRLLEIANSF